MDIKYLWLRKKFNPNDKQREAILHVDGPLFLTAGPGSGKTRVLLWRTLNLIVFQNVAPEKIFLSTFTKKAALQLKEGLTSLLALVTQEIGKPYDVSGMALGTVHSICQKLLAERRFSEAGWRRRPPVLMDELSQYFKIYDRKFWIELFKAGGLHEEEMAQRRINSYFNKRDSYSRHEAVLNVIKFFNRLSEESFAPGSVKTEDEMLNSLLEMYAYYLYAIRNPTNGLKTVDFSLLQQEAFNAMRLLSDQEKLFEHVIIDEYQDTNPIQEKLFFELAKKANNICVVGDDDQALYRFRGATVENLVEFENRCQKFLGIKPKRIDLDTNYRSRKKIVNFYVDFIERIDWAKERGDGSFRVENKKIKSHDQQDIPAVLCSGPKSPAEIYHEIARFVLELKQQGKIQDYNQVAFLFPYLKGDPARVKGFKQALEKLGVPIYAPRAGRFLNVDEARVVFGLFFKIFGRPSHQGSASRGLAEFRDWTRACIEQADSLLKEDAHLSHFVQDKQNELETIASDYEKIIDFIEKKGWKLFSPFKLEWRQILEGISGLSNRTKKIICGRYFQQAIEHKEKSGRPYTLFYVINRITSVDWTILDLFYQLQAFKYFQKIYQLAEEGIDEGPVCNLGLITQYLAKFMEERSAMITASFLHDKKFIHSFFSSFIYALFRLGETEYEYVDDPFPKGRVPFLTIHQAKGLEFPIVVLGSAFKKEKAADKVEVVIREMLKKEGEPLDRVSRFDNARMFYVALSRAKYLTIIPYFKGTGQRTSEPFKTMFREQPLPDLKNFDFSSLPDAKPATDELGKTYSYTADYLSYCQCPRQYMLFKKYGFVPSRSQTMFFGNLVHQTIEDLHYFLIENRKREQSHVD